MDAITEPAKVTKADVGIEDHGIFVGLLQFDYGYSCQGTGGFGGFNVKFIRGFIEACGVDTLSECVGRTVQVTHTDEFISKIAPMKFEEGKEFDIIAWQNEEKRSEKT